MQEENIKNIISRYIKVSADQIGYDTIIDRSSISSSIFLHRMYADLAKAGFATSGYSDIKNYGTLLDHLSRQNGSGDNSTHATSATLPLAQKYNMAIDVNGIGIDIEESTRMPETNDFREDKFYTMYFSPSEISYCILRPDPLLSFAGLFAAKEAIVKANGNYKNHTFNSIIIDHLPGGGPIHPDFHLSISHAANIAIAVAIQKNTPAPDPPINMEALYSRPQNSSILSVVSFSALILAIITLILLILKN